MKAGFSQTRDGVGNADGGQTAAILETMASQTRYGIGNADGIQTIAITKAGFS